MKQLNKPEDCRYYNQEEKACSAPLCPLDHPENYTFFPDEDVCRLILFNKLQWIKNQKKIVKAGANPDCYFTYQMLNRKYSIHKGIEGLNPDKDLETKPTDEAKWLKRHQGSIKPRSPEQIQKGTEALKKWRESKKTQKAITNL